MSFASLSLHSQLFPLEIPGLDLLLTSVVLAKFLLFSLMSFLINRLNILSN